MERGRLNDARWKSMPFVEQIANIGSEVGWTAKWVQKAKPAMAEGTMQGQRVVLRCWSSWLELRHSDDARWSRGHQAIR